MGLVAELTPDKTCIRLFSKESLEIREFNFRDWKKIIKRKAFNSYGWTRKECKEAIELLLSKQGYEI